MLSNAVDKMEEKTLIQKYIRTNNHETSTVCKKKNNYKLHSQLMISVILVQFWYMDVFCMIHVP